MSTIATRGCTGSPSGRRHSRAQELLPRLSCLVLHFTKTICKISSTVNLQPEIVMHRGGECSCLCSSSATGPADDRDNQPDREAVVSPQFWRTSGPATAILRDEMRRAGRVSVLRTRPLGSDLTAGQTSLGGELKAQVARYGSSRAALTVPDFSFGPTGGKAHAFGR